MRVYIGIPMYGGAGGEFVSALLKLRVVLDRMGWEVEVDIHNGCSILTKARNEITQRFYESGFDVLLFLDSDMTFDALDIIKMIQAKEDVSCINYRKKTDDGIQWVCDPVVVDKSLDVCEGMIRVQGAGTGLMAISRKCIEMMRGKFPELRYEEKGQECFALFDFCLKNGRYYGEDYTFCQRWAECGGVIWMLADATVGHVGNKTFKGNFYKHIKGMNDDCN